MNCGEPQCLNQVDVQDLKTSKCEGYPCNKVFCQDHIEQLLTKYELCQPTAGRPFLQLWKYMASTLLQREIRNYTKRDSQES